MLGANDGIPPNYEQSSTSLRTMNANYCSQLAGCASRATWKTKAGDLEDIHQTGGEAFLSFVDDGREKPSPLLELFDGIRQNEAGKLPDAQPKRLPRNAQALRSFVAAGRDWRA